ncbi:MAG: MerC domain-containing protein [Chloroflexota bacterium]
MQLDQSDEAFWKRHLDKIGVGGSLFAALCCLGFPALLAILSAVGLGFLVNDAVLIPLLVLFLLVTMWGLYLGKRHHGSWMPLFIGMAGAALSFASIWFGNGLLAGVGIAGLIAASLLNVWFRMKQLKKR